MESNPSRPAPYSRRIQIVKLLFENGPLSSATIRNLIQPTMRRRRVNDALMRLTESGVVTKRFNQLPLHGSGQLYQLSSKEKFRIELADCVGVARSSFRPPVIRNEELCHSISCAYTAEWFRRVFPDAQVVRDLRLLDQAEAEAGDILNIDLDDKSSEYILPDILMSFKEDIKKPEVHIAIEVERSRKSHKRIREKLRRYMLGTEIDGMIWMCGDEVNPEAIMRIWRSLKEEIPHRGKDYHDFFAMFYQGEKPLFPEERMATSKGWACRLSDWIHILRTTDAPTRSDSLFQEKGLPPTNLG